MISNIFKLFFESQETDYILFIFCEFINITFYACNCSFFCSQFQFKENECSSFKNACSNIGETLIFLNVHFSQCFKSISCDWRLSQGFYVILVCHKSLSVRYQRCDDELFLNWCFFSSDYCKPRPSACKMMLGRTFFALNKRIELCSWQTLGGILNLVTCCKSHNYALINCRVLCQTGAEGGVSQWQHQSAGSTVCIWSKRTFWMTLIVRSVIKITDESFQPLAKVTI